MSHFLLDTHILLWWLNDNPRLSSHAKTLISNPHNELYISSVSIWEASIKRALGRLEFNDDELYTAIDTDGFRELTVSITHAIAAGNLPRHHGDPFDRMLIAQAQTEDLSIITHDAQFQYYNVSLVSV